MSVRLFFLTLNLGGNGLTQSANPSFQFGENFIRLGIGKGLVAGFRKVPCRQLLKREVSDEFFPILVGTDEVLPLSLIHI